MNPVRRLERRERHPRLECSRGPIERLLRRVMAGRIVRSTFGIDRSAAALLGAVERGLCEQDVLL